MANKLGQGLGWLSDRSRQVAALAGAGAKKPGGEPLDGTALYGWQAGTRDQVNIVPPVGAVKASEFVYVVRQKDTGECGKYDARKGRASVALNGKEEKLNEFEFLVLRGNAVASWQKIHGSPPAPGSDPVAWASTRMAVVRPADGGRFPDRDPGKYIADERKVRIPQGGYEVSLHEGEFEFLIIRAAGSGMDQWVPGERALVGGSASSSALPPLYDWVRPRGDAHSFNVPAEAIRASERMFVMRTASGESGKFDAVEGVATVALNGKEVDVDDDFEFLILRPNARVAWSVTRPAECVWASARMAVVRPADGARFPDRDTGKYIADEHRVRIPHGGREVTLHEGEYEYLSVTRETGADKPSWWGARVVGRRQTSACSSSGTAATEAAQAAQALAERGEKLGTLAAASQSLANDAENFADMATQLRIASERC